MYVDKEYIDILNTSKKEVDDKSSVGKSMRHFFEFHKKKRYNYNI